MRRLLMTCAMLLAFGAAVTVAHAKVTRTKPVTHRPKRDNHRRAPAQRWKAEKASRGKKATTKASVSNIDSLSMLLGDQTVESSMDSNSVGLAEAFAFVGQTSGTISKISFYVDSHNRAKSILAAVYSNEQRAPRNPDHLLVFNLADRRHVERRADEVGLAQLGDHLLGGGPRQGRHPVLP